MLLSLFIQGGQKDMSGFFDLDAPIWVFMGEIADIIILALLWWICSLGIITIGASTTALYYVLGKKIRKETTYVAKDFFKSFNQNFRQSVPLSIITIIGFISFVLYCSFIIEGVYVPGQSTSLKYIIPITILFAFELFNFTAYLWALLSRFEMKTTSMMRTTLIMIHKHLITTIVNLAVIAIVIYCVIQFPFAIVVAPSVIVLGQSFMIQKVFNQYIEEAAREEKRKLAAESSEEEANKLQEVDDVNIVI